MAAGPTKEQFNAKVRSNLQKVAQVLNGTYSRYQVTVGHVSLSYQRVNMSNGECFLEKQATNTITGSIVRTSVDGTWVELLQEAEVS